MRIIFCADPMDPKQVDYDYQNEYQSAKKAGFDVSLISFEDLVDFGYPVKAVKQVIASAEKETAIYRGWMLKPTHYKTLYQALETKNLYLINTVEEYIKCHYLPNSYDVISKITPKTVWLYQKEYENSFETIYERLAIFDNSPIILKDFVKSRKHEWEDACFIPNASDRNNVERVIKNFIQRQGNDFNEGLVFREFVSLEYLTSHSKSHMPLTKEFRFFIKNKKIMSYYQYWDEGDYGILQPDLNLVNSVIDNIDSNFFTVDIAKINNGDWIIIELGDAQVSGLPDNADVIAFYQSLKG